MSANDRMYPMSANGPRRIRGDGSDYRIARGTQPATDSREVTTGLDTLAGLALSETSEATPSAMLRSSVIDRSRRGGDGLPLAACRADHRDAGACDHCGPPLLGFRLAGEWRFTEFTPTARACFDDGYSL